MKSNLNYRGKFFKDLYFGFFLSMVLLLPLQSQSKDDAIKLKVALQNSKANSIRAELLLALGKYNLYKAGELKADLDSALVYTNDAKHLSEKLHYKAGIGKSYLQYAKIYREAGNKKEAWLAGTMALNYFKENKMPVLRGDALLELGNQFSKQEKEIQQKIKYFEVAASIFNKVGAKEKQANTLKDLGDMYLAKSDFGTALKLLEQSLVIYKSIGYKDLQGVYIYMSGVYRLCNDSTLAIKNALLAVKTAEELHDNSMQLCMIYNHLGLIYYDLQNFDEAQSYFNKALKVAYLHKDGEAINELSQNIASVLHVKHKNKEAIKVLLGSVTKYPSNSIDVQIVVDHMLVLCYTSLKDYNHAKKYYNNLLEKYKLTNDENLYRGYIYKGIIIYLRESGQIDKTYKYLEEYKNYCMGNKYLSSLNDMEYTYFETDSAKGDFSEAVKHLKRYHYYKDSANSINKTKLVNSLLLKYETEKKDKNIIILKERSKIQDIKIHNSIVMQYVFAGVLLLAIVLISVLYYAYKLKQRVNKKIELKRQQIDEQNVLLKKLLTEKEWLLKEIHHRVKNNLQIVISLLNTQSSFLENKEALAAIHNSQHRMHAMSLIHQRLYQSENLASINMSWYINELVSYLKECLGSDKKIKFKLDNQDIDLDVAQAVPLGLILNEAISNAIKYAFPDKDKGAIEISLKKISENTYRLIVADNGVGLPDNTDFISSKSLGMNLMAGLSDQLDGSFSVKNDNGVKVEVTFVKNKKLPIDSNINA